jgi:hypothetical protein
VIAFSLMELMRMKRLFINATSRRAEAVRDLIEPGRDPADDIKARLDADPVLDFSPKPIVKIDVLQILNLLKNIFKRWI